MSDALLRFHQAVYQRLANDPGLAGYKHASMQAAGVPTFDHVPSGAKQPYNAMESMGAARDGVFGGEGSRLTAQVGTWDNYLGSERPAEIAALIGAALAAPMAVTGWGTVQAEIDNQFVARQDGFRRVVHIISADLYR